MSRATRAHRAFRWLLSLYPGEFTDEYARELAMVFADRYRDATGPADRVRVWIDAVMGVLREAPKEHIQMLSQDLRYAARTLSRSPGFAVIAVLTLALGIGANTAIFQLIDAVNLRTLPIQRPGELTQVRIIGGNHGMGLNPGVYTELTRPIWQELRAHQQAFSGMFAWLTRDVFLGDRHDLRRANGIVVSGEFFRTLGVPPWRGRLLEPADEAAACPAPVAVISHAFWQREMGGRDLGSDARLTIDGERREIIGITPPGFFGVAIGESFDVALPMCQSKEPPRRDVFDIAIMGRLRPGWTIERASDHVQALSPGIFDATAPDGYEPRTIAQYKAFRLGVYPAASGVSALRQQYDMSLRLLLAMTGLVLMLACANLANLMLARMSARDREVAVRLALGASRIRLLRQFLTESCVLAVMGAAAAIAIAQVLSRALIWALSTEAGGPVLALTIDWRILLFAALVAIVTCVVFGVAPALRALRVEPGEAMKTGGRGNTAGPARFAMQRLMVITQIAVSLVLLVAALLFVRSFRNLMTFDPGMRLQGITVGYFGFQDAGVSRDHLNDFTRALLQDVASTPGIVNAATTSNVPLTGSSWTHTVTVGATVNSSKFTWVSPDYFETMGMPILRGRAFTLRDTAASPRVAVVNQAFLRMFTGGANPIGMSMRTSPEPGYPETVYEIVGVIPDSQYSSLREPVPPMTFAPDSQHPSPGPFTAMMIRSSIDPARAITNVKQRLASTHPEVIAQFEILQTRVRDGLLRERLLAMLAGFFGVLAAVLAMVGLYGLIAFAVSQRRQEIGVRVALGAQRRQVMAMIMLDAARLLFAGLAIGSIIALLAGRSAASLLFGIVSYDPVTLLSAIALLALSAAAASFLPARGAARLDPLTALRHE